jgi:hypothetical protein
MNRLGIITGALLIDRPMYLLEYAGNVEYQVTDADFRR